MQVRVLFFGVLKQLVGTGEELVEVAPGQTIGQLFETYSSRFETLRERRSSVLLAQNREFATPDATLHDNDEIAFLPPVSGGSQGHHFAITREVIETEALKRQLQRPEDGAVVVFEGVVRNNTKGRQTTHLEYECYEPMALVGMERIGQEIASQFDLGRIGIVHRLGQLQIGEASVVIVATAPHRRPAFDAALEAINRLKREVPIWKKEFFADGEVWVDGEWDEQLVAKSGAQS